MHATNAVIDLAIETYEGGACRDRPSPAFEAPVKWAARSDDLPAPSMDRAKVRYHCIVY